MTRYTPLDYSVIIPENIDFKPHAEFSTYKPVDLGWGKLNTSLMLLPDISVFKFDSSMEENVQLMKRSGTESTMVETCIFLEGSLESEFEGLERMSMQGGMQNFIYQPEYNVDHFIPAQENLKILHLMIDKTYYTTLLSDDEQWSSDLKENILNKQLTCGLRHNTTVTPRMTGIINDLLNCELKGSLRSIVLEAKILEFLALQLDLLVKEKDLISQNVFKTSDKDRLFALREYLQQTYNHDHSLRGLSRQFGVNEFKLKTGFKSLFKTTVFEYIHGLKMDHARTMLISGEKYVNEISGIVGYKNPNHFSTAFKKRFGVNPGKFRN